MSKAVMASSSTTTGNQARRPRISLSDMPVISLTQRHGATSGSQTHGNDGGGGGVATANGLNESNAVGGEVGSSTCAGSNSSNPGAGRGSGQISRYCKLVPRPDDEQTVVCKLSGYSISCYTEVCGWSRMQPLKFFNIRDSTHLHAMTDGRGEVIKAAEELKSKCITLEELQDLIGSINQVVNCPVFVQVVAKRKVDVVVHTQRLLIIPQVIIADTSGYCVLCSFNEGLATIYNEVEVGDQLLITRCLPQVPRRTYHRGLFSGDKFLNLEVKLQFHSVRNHYICRFSPLKVAQFKMPIGLFDATGQPKLPNELEDEFRQPANARSFIMPPQSEQYYDVIGVVTYVGRIERFQNGDTEEVECLVDGEVVVKKITRYFQYRWIYLMDRSSKPFPVKVYVNNSTLPHQSALVPGAILVLTHCLTLDCACTGKYTATSHFSQLYLEGSIEKYFMLHPPEYRDKTGELLARQNYVQVMSRRDIQLAIGGTHSPKIVNCEKFLSFCHENQFKLWRDITEDTPMVRRESRRIHFDGLILRVWQVNDEDAPHLHYTNQNKYTAEMAKKRETGGNGYKVIENFYSFSRHRNTSWYAFQRKLPPFDPFILHESKCRDIVKKIVSTYKPFCGPLLFPAEMPTYQENGSPPPIADLERVDGAPYLLMDIVNEEARTWYTVIWKNRFFTAQEMLQRVDAARDKQITALAEVYCTEPDAPLEVNLLDFVIK